MHENNEQKKQVVCGIYTRSAMVNPSATARQIAACKQIAEKHGWTIDDRYVYQDDGLSGNKTIGRPALEQLMAAVQDPACPFNVLLVHEASRLARDPSLIAAILCVLTARGISVYTAETELELSSPTGRQLPSAMHPVGYEQVLRKSLLAKNSKPTNGSVLTVIWAAMRLKKEFHMDLSTAKSWLSHFYDVKETCIPGDEHTSTLISAGAVLLASVLVSSRDAHLLSKLTGFPIGFAAAVLLVPETYDLYFSVSYADLINSVRRHPEDLDRIEDAINQLMGEYWERMERHWPNTLNVLRARYLVGGTQQNWFQDEEEFGTFDYEESLLVN